MKVRKALSHQINLKIWLSVFVSVIFLTACSSSDANYSEPDSIPYNEESVTNSNSENTYDWNTDGYEAQCNDPFDLDCDGLSNEVDSDMDGDGIYNLQDGDDNNDGIPDGSQAWDADSDGIPDYVDLDPGGDGIINPRQPGQPSDPFDTDGDGVPNSVDWDKDGDGIAD